MTLVALGLTELESTEPATGAEDMWKSHSATCITATTAVPTDCQPRSPGPCGQAVNYLLS